MKCEKCGKYDATTHVTTVINGQKTESYLCLDCANKGNTFSLGSVFSNEFDNFFSGFLGNTKYNPQSLSQNALVCPNCNSNIREIQSRGKLGCSQCYKVFSELLTRPLKEIHGSLEHTGKIPKRAQHGLRLASEIEKLKKDLANAISDQNFEEAALLRDKIKEMENN